MHIVDKRYPPGLISEEMRAELKAAHDNMPNEQMRCDVCGATMQCNALGNVTDTFFHFAEKHNACMATKKGPHSRPL